MVLVPGLLLMVVEQEYETMNDESINVSLWLMFVNWQTNNKIEDEKCLVSKMVSMESGGGNAQRYACQARWWWWIWCVTENFKTFERWVN